jgi:cytochrome c
MVRPFAAMAAVALLLLTCSASADEHGTRDEAVAMVKRVEAMFKKDVAATLKAVSDKSDTEFHDRDLYPFIYDMNGTCVAHGARPALIRKNLIDLIPILRKADSLGIPKSPAT